MDKIDELLTRGVDKIYPNKEALDKVLRSGKKLKLYQGFDPTMPNLTLGNFVGLMKLRQFQLLGHEVIFLIGDFTGMIGDPTDKLSTRKPLTRDQVVENSKMWKVQAGKILDFNGNNPVRIKYNSDWSDNITFRDIIEITSHLTVGQMLERDMFQKRLIENKPIHLHEFLYPVAQGYDSIAMDIDLEVGGSDQTFNMLAGRTLMKALRNKEKYVLTTKLLVDKEGNKVGKTSGNALFLNSTPEQFFGGIMSFPDETIGLGFELLTDSPYLDINDNINENPMREKKRLAYEVSKLLWGGSQAEEAKKSFETAFQKRDVPGDIPSVRLDANYGNITDILVSIKMVKSKSEAKRLIREGAVEIDGLRITDPNTKPDLVSKGTILKIGKFRFIRINI